MGPADRSGSAGTPAASAVLNGIVSRPGLFARLDEAGRVTEVSAPAGSGKTLLLASWIAEADLAGRAARVPVQGEERDPQQFWLSVLGALRETAAGSKLVRPLMAAPDLDGWTVVERLLADLAVLPDRVWLVIDDLHELRSAEAVSQLELLIMRAPPELRFVLATRHDLRLGLHRLRLAGDSPRSARRRASPARRRGRCSKRPGLSCPARPSRCCTSGPRAGRPGCGWRRCRWPAIRTRTGSRSSFPAASGPWRSTCWPRCSTGSRRRSGGCCCGPRYWTG